MLTELDELYVRGDHADVPARNFFHFAGPNEAIRRKKARLETSIYEKILICGANGQNASKVNPNHSSQNFGVCVYGKESLNAHICLVLNWQYSDKESLNLLHNSAPYNSHNIFPASTGQSIEFE